MPSSEPSTDDSDVVVEHTLIQSSAAAFSANPRTLADVREEVAQSLALRMITKARTVDGVRIGVHFTFSKKDDGRFLRLVTSHIPTTGASPTSRGARSSTRTSNALVICGSDEDDVQRAVLLASSKFLGRVDAVQNTGTLLAASVRHIGSSYDDAALWDLLSKSLEQMTPRQAYGALHDPTYPMPVFLVDIGPASPCAREGGIHGSLIIERSEGYTSSWAAASLYELGLLNATDIVGGPPSTISDEESYQLSQPSFDSDDVIDGV
ncbi:hypothetical protein DEU56DRAFT_787897 [Suillus clintonianus]|uniref:uncharacterized protein n=1 Tax=Suillus clintonianus TaxID=1904413 RepID=UPI001B87D977|nr:uncharacterized protein DEU56DRAFT_787897 [Suillus clintonianus]KAG2145769.1 hypothetical protein DEU56DRAFT_787897 [Suillus clintonianus]